MRPRPALLVLLAALAVVLLGARADASGLDLALWGQILERHTQATEDLARVRVDYAGLRGPGQADWQRLLDSLASADPDALASRNDRLAFWVNAYNILAIDVVLKAYPLESIRDAGSFFSPVWKRPAGRVGGRTLSLDAIEHEIVRPMGDPRTHVALVCASLSCPALLREPWRGESLDAQLDAHLRQWLADPRKGARLDRGSATLHLSKIFDWFDDDFAAAGGVLAFVTPYLPADDRAWLEARRKEGGRIRLDHFDYDWSLNDLATR